MCHSDPVKCCLDTLCRLLGAKLLYEWAARRLGAGGFQTLATEVVGAATGFAFASIYLDADLLSRLPKTIIP